jgi:hypothetical protein
VKLPRDWKELIGLLCLNRVRFLVVGAHALAFHGRPRATGDLDLLVEPTPLNARRLGVALEAFGFPALARETSRFARPDQMATLGNEPLRIDIMTSISGVSFSEAWKGRAKALVGGHQVGFLGLVQFVKNKTAAGRPKDLLDLALLTEGEISSTSAARPRVRSKIRKTPR